MTARWHLLPAIRGLCAIAAAKLIAVIVAALAGALAAAGCGLAALFELQGFGTPRDAEPRPAYLVLYGVGMLMSVAIPLALWKLLLPGSAPAAGWLALAVAAIAVVMLLGIVAAG